MMRKMEKMVRETQDKVCAAIEEIDGCKFRTDAFVRPGGGGGITKVMQGGRVWEKAGVAVSVVYGTMPAESYRMAVGNPNVKVQKVGAGWGGWAVVLCRGSLVGGGIVRGRSSAGGRPFRLAARGGWARPACGLHAACMRRAASAGPGRRSG